MNITMLVYVRMSHGEIAFSVGPAVDDLGLALCYRMSHVFSNSLSFINTSGDFL